MGRGFLWISTAVDHKANTNNSQLVVAAQEASIQGDFGEKKARSKPGFERIQETGVSRGSKETTGESCACRTDVRIIRVNQGNP
jgi:hypothetical protein